jgi:hypothetical protein
MGGVLGIQIIILAAPPPVLPIGSRHLQHFDARPLRQA